MGLFRDEYVIGSRTVLGADGGYKIINDTEMLLNDRGRAAKRVSVLALSGLLALGVLSDEGLGAWGHGTTERPSADMDREANAKYELAKQQASPSQLFSLRYTDTAHLQVKRTATHHSGIYGTFLDSSDVQYGHNRVYAFKDGCLNDTAYDINGGKLHFDVAYHGLFSSVSARASGDVPTAAAQAFFDPENHHLTIKTGNARPDDLHFKVVDQELFPINRHTRDLLTTYGCKPEPIRSYSFTADDSPTSY